MSSTARTLTVALLLTVLATLSACNGGSAPQSPRGAASVDAPAKALTPGTCWDDAQLPEALGVRGFDDWVKKYAAGDSVLGGSMRDDAAFDKVIECTEPHALELYKVVRLTPGLAGKVGEYADLLDQGSPLYRKIRDQVNDRCLAGSPYGKAQRAGGISVQLSPWLSASGGLHVAWDPFPADLWAKGQKRFVCTFEQDKPGTLLFADLTTTKVPVAARVCLNTPRKYRPCAGKHQAEVLAEMTLNTAIETGQINGRKAIRKGPDGPYVALSDAEYARLDKVCRSLFSAVSNRRGGVTARAYPGAASQWPTHQGDYVASCFALKPFEPPPLITGTVFDKG